MNQSNEIKVTIPPRTVLTVAAVLLGLWVLYQVREIVMLFLMVVALVVAFSPIVRRLQRYMPRTLAIILLYLLLFLIFVAVTAIILPPVIYQLNDFIHYLQSELAFRGYSGENSLGYLRENLDLITQGKSLQALGQVATQFKGSLGAFYSSTLGVIGSIIGGVTVFITSFYLLLEEKRFHHFLGSLLPESQRKKVVLAIDGITDKMGDWLRSQLLLMLIIGVVDGLAMALLGVPYALLLGVWAGIMELIPFVGPIIGAIPAVLIGFSSGGVSQGLLVLAVYLIVQQIENQFLVPKIMGKALGLSPVIIIFSLLVGGKLFGFMGVVIAVPLTAALAVILDVWHKPDQKTT